MRLLKSWFHSTAVLLILSGAAFADVTVSQSNDPTASLDVALAALLGQERQAFGAVPAGRLEALAKGAAQAPAAIAAAAAPAADAAAVKTASPEPAGKTSAQKTTLRKKKLKNEAILTPVRYEAGWVASQPNAKGSAEWRCLATALYFEARGETVKGQFAVAEVILNRVDSPAYPQSICGVVNQRSSKGCQFSFICDGNSEAIREQAAFVQAGKIASVMLAGAPRGLTQGATYFHTTNVRPGWAHKFPRTAAIGSHLFYRQPS